VDRKCAEDFQAAIAKGGLEGRKMMQGLLEYKCGVVVGTPVHVNVPQHDGQWARITIPDGPDLGKSGWVPAAWLLGELAGK
jgi:hypothetical protein